MDVVEGEVPRVTRYKAFLSYSRRDDRTAKWLHAALEAYRTPKDITGSQGNFGVVPRRIAPVFRDRTDLTSGGDLSGKLVEALGQSEFLVVLCSPASAQSVHVSAEIENFRSMRGLDRILPVIVAGEPNSGAPDIECLPQALRSSELLAADLRDIKRKSGQRIGDGREGAKFKLIAGILGVPLDALLQRERKRQSRRAAFSAAASVAFLGLAVAAGVAAWVAVLNEQEARRQTATAQASADFLVNTFEVAIPAKESPDTITARTILNRGAARVAGEFPKQPAVKSRLMDAIARAYTHLGLTEDARKLLEADLPTLHSVGADGVQALLTLARLHQLDGKLDEALAITGEAEKQLAASGRNRPDLRGYVFESRGSIYYDLSQAEESARQYDLALAEYRKESPPNPDDLARALNNKGPSLTDQQKFDEAEQVLLQANKLYAESSGERSLFFGQNLYALAINAYVAKKFDEADGYVDRSVSILSGLLDPAHPTLGDLYALKGQILIDKGDQNAARANLQKAVSIYEAAFGKPYVSTGVAIYYLAVIELNQKNYEKALLYFDQAKIHFDSTFPPNHANQGDLLVQRSAALRGLGRVEEADKACASGMDIVVKATGLNSKMYQEDQPVCPATKPGME